MRMRTHAYGEICSPARATPNEHDSAAAAFAHVRKERVRDVDRAKQVRLVHFPQAIDTAPRSKTRPEYRKKDGPGLFDSAKQPIPRIVYKNVNDSPHVHRLPCLASEGGRLVGDVQLHDAAALGIGL